MLNSRFRRKGSLKPADFITIASATLLPSHELMSAGEVMRGRVRRSAPPPGLARHTRLLPTPLSWPREGQETRREAAGERRLPAASEAVYRNGRNPQHPGVKLGENAVRWSSLPDFQDPDSNRRSCRSPSRSNAAKVTLLYRRVNAERHLALRPDGGHSHT
ncbi:hypothetical protein GN956_G17358 [Arapaima gigas]